ncbi:hypothetical protein [Mesorhizobium sp. M8A.F.Ca.ET.165.01.1.1]|uniref:hypothetical protein n=1 Tax=Mesorhizobium sp. M8A.F.Ca.ET.165.01.1.1 TaxID=2563960 RepID=UPI0010936009|nr:hypothetical protein [Mesorhizobium sp. M8A.F.Ca.ET.165.01.1.1]TGT36194.1 hypothetical protein EN808_29865 [Mesorhizobium sp. M8A.F.Ca.ET.165.01.1.1]
MGLFPLQTWNSIGVSSAIAVHRAAVAADEAMFNDAGHCLDLAGAERTEAREQAAWEAFIDVQCDTAADVQAKIAYALAPAVGFRECNLSMIGLKDGEDFDLDKGPARTRRFLQSLVLPS